MLILNIAAFVLYLLLSHVGGYNYKTIQYINRDRKENIQWVMTGVKKNVKYHNLTLLVTVICRVVLLVGGYYYGLSLIMLILAFVFGRFAFIKGKEKSREQCALC